MPYISSKNEEYINTIPEGLGDLVRPVYADGQISRSSAELDSS